MILSAIAYGLGIIGSIALFVYPLTARERPSLPVRRGFLIVGPVGVIWGTLGLVNLFFGSSLSRNVYISVGHLRGVFGGIGIGILLLLFVLGEMKVSRRPPREDDRNHATHEDNRAHQA